MGLGFTNIQKKHIEDSPFHKSIKLITDEPAKDALSFKKYAVELSNIIANSTPRFTVGIYGGWGTGKTTLMEMIERELKNNYRDKIVTIWFDSWRYEREEYSAMVPLLRTINLSIDDALKKTKEQDHNKKKVEVLTRVRQKFKKLSDAIIRNTNINIGINSGNFGTGTTFDIGKIIDVYHADGSFISGQERIYFHKHISDQLKEELLNIRYDEYKNVKYDFRIVIFVDDLDRCTPDRALELLESVKTFFDIEGIIYVIGMDPRTIDPIIESKYGKGKKIDGLSYLQKIVQLPFQIPVWNREDLSKTIRDMISSTGLTQSDINEILNDTNIELIIGTAQSNPRDVKRFINIVILSKYIYGLSFKDIEKLISIQAFYFRGNEWISFLKLMIPDNIRIKFLKHFLLLLKEDEKNIIKLEDLKLKIQASEKRFKSRLESEILQIFDKLIELNDIDLFIFLKNSAVSMLRIDRINRYLRTVETSDLNTNSILDLNALDLGTDRQLKLLKERKVIEFNRLHPLKNQQLLLIHIPYEDLSMLKLNKINLKGAFLCGTDFSGADLRRARLEDADLAMAKFIGSRLTGAYMNKVDLTAADLTKAKFSGAEMIRSNLSSAKIFKANFQGAALTYANLSGAYALTVSEDNFSTVDVTDFPSVNLSKSSLFEANLSGANLRGANLSNSHLIGADLTGADLTGADLTGADLTDADLSNVTFLWNNRFGDLKINGANFQNAVIVDSDTGFYGYISDSKKGNRNVPKQITDTDDLQNRLKLRHK